MAKIGSSQPPVSPLGGRRLGSAGAAAAPAAEAAPTLTGTLAQRLEYATLAGALTAVPAAYDDGPDWETIRGDDVFARLYLAAPLQAQITDAQVAANQAVLAGFWQAKLNRFITGDRDVEDTYGPGTVSKAQEQLQVAAAALADATSRAACFEALSRRRREAAGQKMSGYLRLLLQSPVLNNKMFHLALQEGESFGFLPAEAEAHLLGSLRQAGYAPVKTVGQSPNLLLAEWTPGGAPLTNRPSTKVMGQDVYSLAEAGQLLYAALTSTTERDKALRNLDSADYLENIAKDLKENDVQLDLRDIRQNRQLDQAQRRLKALYLLGPGLPFYLDGVVPEFTSPAQLLSRTAVSAKDFGVAEAAFTAGLLPIWLHAAATAEVKAALPPSAKPQALDFRRWLHRAAPAFPLWLGEAPLAGTADLAAYIRRNEQNWQLVYGSLTAGNLAPWLAARGESSILERQEQLAQALLGPGLEANSEPGRQLAVQALLEALEPLTDTPTLETDLTKIDLTGLSGEAQVERVLTLTNTTGGPVRVFLALLPALAGVQLSVTQLYFGQRAPGQQHRVVLRGSPAQMPRDGQHAAKLTIRTAYAAGEIPVAAEAVFPGKEFWTLVLGAGLGLAAALGSIRVVLGALLGESTYQRLLARGGLLPLSQAGAAGDGPGGIFLLALLLLGGTLYGFYWILRKQSQPTQPA